MTNSLIAPPFTPPAPIPQLPTPPHIYSFKIRSASWSAAVRVVCRSLLSGASGGPQISHKGRGALPRGTLQRRAPGLWGPGAGGSGGAGMRGPRPRGTRPRGRGVSASCVYAGRARRGKPGGGRRGPPRSGPCEPCGQSCWRRAGPSGGLCLSGGWPRWGGGGGGGRAAGLGTGGGGGGSPRLPGRGRRLPPEVAVPFGLPDARSWGGRRRRPLGGVGGRGGREGGGREGEGIRRVTGIDSVGRRCHRSPAQVQGVGGAGPAVFLPSGARRQEVDVTEAFPEVALVDRLGELQAFPD